MAAGKWAVGDRRSSATFAGGRWRPPCDCFMPISRAPMATRGPSPVALSVLRAMLCLSAALATAGASEVGIVATKDVTADGHPSSGVSLPPSPSLPSLLPPADPLRSLPPHHPFFSSPPAGPAHAVAPIQGPPPLHPPPTPQQQPVADGGAPPPAIDYGDAPGGFPHDADPAPAGPLYFATENSTAVTAQIGSTALVPCVVRNIGDGMVSWIRRKDYHLLTVGLTTYSSDERYSAVHAQHSEDWTLQIKYVQERDAGLYECQVSSHPPTSIFIDLRVVEARADILGPSEKYLKSGSMLRLSCVLRQSTEPPVFVFWYHNNRMINYDRDRGVNVTSPLLASGAAGGGAGVDGMAEAGEEGATSAGAGDDGPGPEEEHASTLVIASAQKTHSGNYSCVPNNAQPASTYVHILNAGENPAAMQHGGRGLSWLRSPSAWLLAACLAASLSPSWRARAAPVQLSRGTRRSPRLGAEPPGTRRGRRKQAGAWWGPPRRRRVSPPPVMEQPPGASVRGT